MENTFKNSNVNSWIDSLDNQNWKTAEFIVVVLNLFNEVYHLYGTISNPFSEYYGIKLGNDIEEIWSISSDIDPPSIIELKWGLKLGVDISEWYRNALIPMNIMDEYYQDAGNPYGIFDLKYRDAFTPTKIISEDYGDIPLIVKYFYELYSDVPFTRRIYLEPYNDAAILVKAVNLLYRDSVNSSRSIEESWDILSGPITTIIETYGISQTAIQNVIDELYPIETNDFIRNYFDELYYILSDSTQVDIPDVSFTVNGVPVDFLSMDIEAGTDKYSILGTVTLASEDEYIKCAYLADCICSIEGEDFYLFIEDRSTTKTNEKTVFSVSLVSPTVKLDAPYSPTLIRSFPDGIDAETLVNQMAAEQSITVDYQIMNWEIASYSISINDETPLEVIRRVVNAVGGIMQTKPNGDLLIISKYTISPTEWVSETPTNVFSTTSDLTSIGETIKINSGNNAFIITDQNASSKSIILEEIDIEPGIKIIKGFRVPFSDGPFDLETSGGVIVSIDKTINPIEEDIPIVITEDDEEWEYVEFIDWVGTTRYPIYEVLDYEWIHDVLGSFQLSENGTLTIIDQSSVPSESLLRIKYKTKYWEWIVRAPIDSHIQFFVPEED